MSQILDARGSSVIAPTTAHHLIDPHTGQSFHDADAKFKFNRNWACRSHARQAATSKVKLLMWQKALLEVIFRNRRFAVLSGYREHSGGKGVHSKKVLAYATPDGASRALAELKLPVCCFLSGEERRMALDLAGDPETFEDRVRDRHLKLRPPLILPPSTLLTDVPHGR